MSNKQLPGAQSVIQFDLLAHIEASKKGGLTQQQLLRHIGPQITSDEVTGALKVLQRDGRVVKRDDKWVALRFTDFGVGTIQVLERGDATIRSGSSGEVGWFVRRRDRAGSRQGDLVLFIPVTQRKGRNSFSGLRGAKVVEVARASHRQLVGTLEGEDQQRWLVPFDPKIKTEIEVSDSERVLDDQYVVVELDSSSKQGKGPLRARLGEVLGSIDQPGVDVEVVLRHFEIPESFSEAVLSAAQDFPADPRVDDFQGREDLRDRKIVTIDGESSRDFDDAISVKPLPEGAYELGVHIADVSAYVREGTPLDLEAYQRGTSVYYPDRAIPMLPEHLSNGVCSLRPHVPRLTLSAFLIVSPDGHVSDRRFSESVICSSQRLTYGEVATILTQKKPGSYDVEIVDLLHNAQKLMLKMMEQRTARGSIDFDLPEGDVVLDAEGFTVGVQP